MKHRFIAVTILSLLTISLSSQSLEAEKAFMTKDFDRSIKLCLSELKTKPHNQELLILLGMSYQEIQDYQNALDTYNRVKKSEDLTLIYLKAECMEVLGDISKAYQSYSKIYNKDNSQDHALRNMARIALKRKNWEKAEEYYTILCESYPDNFLFRKNLATSKYNTKNEMGSLIHFKIAWSLNKKDLSLPISIANVHAIQQEPFKALEYLYEGLEYDSANVAILKTAAIIHYKLEVYDTATYFLNRAMAAGDSSVFTHKYLGMSLLNNFMFEASVPHLRIYFEDDTLNSEASYYLGLALSTMHQKHEGIDMLNRTISLMTPDSSMVGSIYSTIGRTWMDINDCPNSLLAYNKAIAYDPTEPIYIFELAKVYDQSGRNNTNIDHLKKAKNLFEEFVKEQTAAMEKVMEDRDLDPDQVSAPGVHYAKERIKKIRDELFFLGEIKE